MEQKKDQNQLEQLAYKVLQLDIRTLMVDLRYLRVALQQLELSADPRGILSTDGQYLFYDPRLILRRYKAEPAASVRDYLHIVLHCIFRHMYVSTGVRRDCWDVACDLAVEAIIQGLEVRSAAAAREKAQRPVLDDLRGKLHQLTAEKIYYWLLEQAWPSEEIGRVRSLFYADDHTDWYPEALPEEPDEEEKPPQEAESMDSSPSKDTAPETLAQQEEIEREQAERQRARAVMETIWADLAQQVEVELQTFAKGSERIDALTQNLLAVNREKYDYAAFLQKFAVRSEVLQLNPDEFDYIFYTYGLQLYQNIPLIEPLEYKEIRRVHSFVVALDTSGSTTGALVQHFVQKTYNILQSTDSFFSKIELYILQCDDDVREAVRITSLDELDAYLQSMQIIGHGGTDFRPVFSYVDDLRRQGELRDLKGLIYFTDGYGTFPAIKPDYETAFVFVDDEYKNPEVPPWAIRLVLRPEEIGK